MPNLDGGHYFLTTLAPIKVGSVRDADGQEVSHVQLLRKALQKIPTALQSPATEEIGVESPFAKSLKTHLCRLVVIDDAIYNGRNGSDAILVTLGLKPQPLDPQHIDYLPCPYLFFSADIDAVMKPGDPLPDTLSVDQQNAVRDQYFKEMWTHAYAEISEIYQHCQDFDKVETAEDFARYMTRCQIETWMPFNDYYTGGLSGLPQLPMPKIKKAVAIPAALTVLCLVLGLADSLIELLFDRSLVPGWIWAGVPIFGLLTWLALKWAYNLMLSTGQSSWPAAKYGSLPNVLKGLYTQQHFADFVVANQGAKPADLHKAFGDFIAKHNPSDVLTPETTQTPGVISSKMRPAK
ncbi:hypothetical protein KHP62_08495 [Rhodobacteraceae bacterium NNCM2]|nr:hypothetical protein [Coraliihabitans acroporae]